MSETKLTSESRLSIESQRIIDQFSNMCNSEENSKAVRELYYKCKLSIDTKSALPFSEKDELFKAMEKIVTNNINEREIKTSHLEQILRLRKEINSNQTNRVIEQRKKAEAEALKICDEDDNLSKYN